MFTEYLKIHKIYNLIILLFTGNKLVNYPSSQSHTHNTHQTSYPPSS